MPTKRLDAVLRDHGVASVDFIKMNIEGSGSLALEGATLTLQTTKHWAIECHDFLAQSGVDPFMTYERVIEILKQSRLHLRFRLEDTGSKRYYVYASRCCGMAR